MTAIIKARLWKLSQRKLFDRTAARRLKPLGCTGEAFEQSLGSQVILDEGHPSSRQGQETFEEAVNLPEMLDDEGYCSQATVWKLAKESDDLLFEEDKLMLEEEWWESDILFEEDNFFSKNEMCDSDLLFSEDEVAIENEFLDDDLFWEEEGPIRIAAFDEDLFHGEESTRIPTIQEDLFYNNEQTTASTNNFNQGTANMLDDMRNRATTLSPTSNLNITILDTHAPHFFNHQPLVESSMYFQVGGGAGEEMLLAG